MKKIFMLVMLGAALPAWSVETVTAVNFNPSRSGDYKYLKVTNSASFPGGISTTSDVLINSSNTVDMVDVSDSARTYTIDALSASTSTVTIDMPSASVQNSDSTISYTASTGTSAPSGLINAITVKGGRLDFSAGTADSFINKLNYYKKMHLRANNLITMSDTLSIEGSSSGTQLLDSAGDNFLTPSSMGLWLGGYDIPIASGTSKTEVYNVTGNLESSAHTIHSCTLSWLSRTLTNNSSKYILGLSGCTIEGVSEQECTGTQVQEEACSCTGTVRRRTCTNGSWGEWSNCMCSGEDCCSTKGEITVVESGCKPLVAEHPEYIVGSSPQTVYVNRRNRVKNNWTNCGVKRMICVDIGDSCGTLKWRAVVPLNDLSNPMCEQTAACDQSILEGFDGGSGSLYYQTTGLDYCPIGTPDQCCLGGGGYYLPGFAWVGHTVTSGVAHDCGPGGTCIAAPGAGSGSGSLPPPNDDPIDRLNLTMKNSSQDPYQYSFYYAAGASLRASGAWCKCNQSVDNVNDGQHSHGCSWQSPSSCGQLNIGSSPTSWCSHER